MNKIKQKISVLGCGWLGLPLAIYLFEKGFFVNGSTTSKDKMIHLESNHIIPFLIDIDRLKNNSEFFKVDVLIIAITSKNVESFKDVILKIEESAIERVIFISSTSVYPISDHPIEEEHETIESPLASIEELFLSNQNFKTTIIRFGGLFGADRKPGNFFKNGKIIGNPDGVVNMIHRDDCIAIIEQIIKTDSADTIFNACVEQHPTRREFYTKARLNLGLGIPSFEENSTLKMKLISSEKLKNKLNYTFIHSDLLNI